MMEMFTDRARKVMQLANQEAIAYGHEYIGTEHVLLGLIKEGSGVASTVLRNLDCDVHKIHVEIDKIVQKGLGTRTNKLPYTPKVIKIIEYAIDEAKQLNHKYIGTEHLLLGLLRESGGVACQILVNFGLNVDQVRKEVLFLLVGEPEEEKDYKDLLLRIKNKIKDATVQNCFQVLMEVYKELETIE
jgi:ATP-dependent Clp protease ATP-binding subunit ClpC